MQILASGLLRVGLASASGRGSPQQTESECNLFVNKVSEATTKSKEPRGLWESLDIEGM